MTPILPATLDEICRQLSATLQRPLGQGAFKQAFLVERDGKPFALKVARASPGLQERFEREVQTLTSCSHPCIATLHENFVYTSGGETFWVSVEEYLAHGTLETRLAAGVLPPAEIRTLGILLIGAIAHLSVQGFVHRDIKPANILFRDSSTPVLTDFGIVRVLGAPSLTADFMMQGPGTPFFAAPEQLVNDKALIDWRTDQFGLGLVLCIAAIGRHSFQPPGGTQRDAIEAVALRVPVSSAVRSELTALGLTALIRALGVWPHQRYPSPEEMLAALSKEG